MTATSAFGFLLTSACLFGLRARTPSLAWAARSAALLVGVIALLTSLAFCYDLTGSLGLSALATVAPLTTASFLLFSVGTSCVDPERGPLELLTGARLGSAMARQLLPLAILIPFALSVLRFLGLRAGWYGSESGMALFAVANVVTVGILISRAAFSLNQNDERRRRAEDCTIAASCAEASSARRRRSLRR
jgi:hypothetical protein